jgi:hypothetical protein
MDLASLFPHIQADVTCLAEIFRDADPYPHIIFDGFLDKELCGQLLKEFPAYDVARFRNPFGHDGKAEYPRLADIGPWFRVFDEAVRSQGFVHWLERVTGIKSLVPDPTYLGAGAQENRRGMSLFPHIDFNIHLETGYYRRLNLLLYLNEEWNEEWGGCLQLFKDPKKQPNPTKSIVPVFNRCALFATSERSWHSVNPINIPAALGERGRKSVSMYFYSARGPEDPGEHRTLWVYPAPPASVVTGSVLNQDIIDKVERCFILRDTEIAEHRGSKNLKWCSPLPENWLPGYALTAEDCQWIDKLMAERDKELEYYWWLRWRC